MEYAVLCESNLNLLVKLVTQYIRQGWEPCGMTHWEEVRFYQAMIRRTESGGRVVYKLDVIDNMILAYHNEVVAPLEKEVKQVVSVMEEMARDLSVLIKKGE